MKRNLLTILLGIWSVCNTTGYSEPVRGKHSSADLLIEAGTLQPGQETWLAVRIQLDDGWHTYWKNPGESGMAPRFSWDLPEGLEVGPAQFTYPARFESDGIVSFGYEKEALFLFPLTVSEGVAGDSSVSIGLRASWLVCRELCLPESARLALVIPMGSPTEPDPDVAARFAGARDQLPSSSEGWAVNARRQGREYVLRAQPPEGAGPILSAAFLPDQPNLWDYATASVWQIPGPEGLLKLTVSPLAEETPEEISGVLVWRGEDAREQAVTLKVPVE